jgi:AAA15 family ATPase/GTPase
MNKFERLSVEGWRQFESIDIEFHPRLTVIAGANGAGKSTLLRILSQHFGYSYTLLATPTWNKGVLSYLSGIFKSRASSVQESGSVGTLKYSNSAIAQLKVPPQGSMTYNLQINGAQQVDGLFINSHRPLSTYQAISSIPTNAITAQQAYQTYSQEVMNRYNNSYSQYSPLYRIKEAIVSMATFGPGNKNVARNEELERSYEDFKRILSKVLPSTIGFLDISIRIPDIVIVTKTGEFVIDASSGGLMALIDLAWQMFLYSRGRSDFVAVIDEPENHLHPSIQRIIISNLLGAFPKAQLIVATHSPFVVTSVKDSAVYVLRYHENQQSNSRYNNVFSQKLDNVNKASSASETLRSVLGVPVTLPLWAENEIETLAQEFDITTLDAQRISELRDRLAHLGLADFYAEALNAIGRRQ